ncbi:hypothetical protein KSW81_002605 [Nannochloris sp. 'desiccata']|nr:hypothetical protein KSW81_002605 [Chlorella desiccata (nom. nud.)]
MSDQSKDNTHPQTPEEEVTSSIQPSVLSQGADAIAALFSEISEAPSQPFSDPLEDLRDDENQFRDHQDEDDDEWHELDQFTAWEPRLNILFEKDQRQEILLALRRNVRTQLATPKTILLRDKITFTLGTLDLLISAYWLGASPTTFYKLYSAKAAVLLAVRFFYYRSKRWHYYMFDLCYAYETLYNYVTSRKGLFSVVVLRFPRKLQPLAYQTMHMALTFAVMALNTIWWSNSTAALGFIVAAFVVAAWHGASFYFDHFAHRYVAGLGIERKVKRKTPPPVAVEAPQGGQKAE